jgi:general secretion pathway protein E
MSAIPQTPKAERRGRSGVPTGYDDGREEFEAAFIEFLDVQKLADRSILDRAGSAARKTGERFDRVLTKLGLLSESDLAAALSRFLNIPLVAPADVPMEPLLGDVIEPQFVRHNKIMPLAVTDEWITVGATDPLNQEPFHAMAYLTGRAVKIRIFAPADFDKTFDSLYKPQTSASRTTLGGEDASELDVQRLRDMASEAPVIRLVNQIIADAVEGRASDIHVEPNVDSVLVRYRVDGMLRTGHVLASGLRAAITSRIKIMSKLDIAERRMPQDGRIKIAVRGVDIDFRVSTIPTVFGESVVMRILDRSRVELDFDSLGFHAKHVDALNKLLAEPNDIILVTGPTGSGKTTTLYTALKGLNTPDTKVFTVEDPVEYQIAGINQVQVQGGIGFDFPHALRSILRQDPDIIMIGEIRDLETARIAIQSSLTGHLVLSTLHTNSAAAAISRLVDMGVENYLLASTLKGVLAQRLVRTLCARCAVEHDSATYWADEFSRNVRGLEAPGSASIKQARGCPECHGIGFSGRSTIVEILLVDSYLRRLILSNASDAEVERTAHESGMESMYEMGVHKVWRGETSVDEVLRATRMNS